jgi:hypothetical protein
MNDKRQKENRSCILWSLGYSVFRGGIICAERCTVLLLRLIFAVEFVFANKSDTSWQQGVLGTKFSNCAVQHPQTVHAL